MKIRTDFVTNSSSSSFVVEISVNDVNGKKHVLQINPFGNEYSGSVDIDLNAGKVLKAKDITQLTSMLAKSVSVNSEMFDEDQECDKDRIINKCVTKVKSFGKNLEKKIENFENISSISFKQIWNAYGEFSSCFGANIEICDPDLLELAKNVCDFSGEEKETAKTELLNYLSNYPGTIENDNGDSFPYDFMGSKAKAEIVWEGVVSDVEELAVAIVSGKLIYEDNAVATTIVDLKNKRVKQSLKYVLTDCEGRGYGYDIYQGDDSEDGWVSAEDKNAGKASGSGDILELNYYRGEVTDFSDAKPGNTIFFGSYEQDNDLSNGKESVEWIVLAKDKEKNRILVISKYAIDCKPFNIEFDEIDWSGCTLRPWLNNDFINESFSQDEQNKIVSVDVTDDENPKCLNHTTGEPTNDKVFLLSIKELQKYFKTNEARKCKWTDFAHEKLTRAKHLENCYYWLRTQGSDRFNAAAVKNDGTIVFNGVSVYDTIICVRPAMWIDLGE